MKRFILKALYIISVVFVLYASAWYYASNQLINIGTSQLVCDKINILKKTSSPKIIIIGGSNINSIDNKYLSESTGYNVINLGINANFGIRFWLEIASLYYKNGDILIVSPEYENFYSERVYYGNDIVAVYVVKNIRNISIPYINSVHQFYSIIINLPPAIFKYLYSNYILDRPAIVSFTCDEFGGTNRAKIEFKGKGFDENVFISPSCAFNTAVVKDLLMYRDKATQKGAKLMIAYPYIPEATYKLNKSKLNKVHQILSGAGLNVLAPPSEAFAAKIYFDDAIYHLNPIGSLIRTGSLINSINNLSHMKSTNL